MFNLFLNQFQSNNRRSRRTSVANYIETCEPRTLLSAASHVPVAVSVEHVHQPAAHAPIHVASLANFNGDWQTSAGSVLHFTQSGRSVSGTQTAFGTAVANFSGKVHGKKLIGELTSIGIDAHSQIKVHLTDATHFAGKRHFFINGASQGTQPIIGAKN